MWDCQDRTSGSVALKEYAGQPQSESAKLPNSALAFSDEEHRSDGDFAGSREWKRGGSSQRQ